ncbi:hypothetical protein AsAng_0041840 [Aureispira anguillae]|uniref:Uncharacterized protein n=1 Tax=Aureispira anguillae TaxID=2864201 RepID=A0A916DUK5_9BACT|nr:hypothetical protein AsAng_0041840 [Aureispira anguillae]
MKFKIFDSFPTVNPNHFFLYNSAPIVIKSRLKIIFSKY